MLKLFILSLVCTICCVFSYAQSQKISGSVSDTTEKKVLINAAVSILRREDSVLISFTRANASGQFSFAKILPGNYLIMVTYPKFADYVEAFAVKEGSDVEMGTVNLIRKSELLKEVIVRQQISAIRFRGDTTEFKADSFRVSAGASVEDLLKVLPGIQVNRKGEITAQGQKVEKVLVDGEEFFGDDPTMATQNLNAKSVDKVQVFDKKSDEANLTGVDDGKTAKTVNLVLKDDAKKGYFGRVEAGSDANRFYQGKATASSFKGSKKMGFLVTANRTGENRMTWNELRDFSTGYSSGVNDNGDAYVSINDEEDNLRNNEGIPTAVNGAIMYSNKYGPLKNSTNGNYNYKYFENAGDGRRVTQYILPDTSYFSNQTRHVEQSRYQNSFRIKNEWNLDSLTTVDLNLRAITDHKQVNSHYLDETLDQNRVPVNTGDRTRSNSTDSKGLNTELFIRRKLNSKGRLLSATFTNVLNDANQNGYLLNTNDFFKNGQIDSIAKTDQLKKVVTNSNTFTGKLNFIQPITKKLAFILNYTYSNSRSDQDYRSYDNHAGKYDSLNTRFSNHFKFINIENQGSGTLRYNTPKLSVSLGAGLQNLTLKERNVINDSSFTRSFSSVNPNASIRYKLGQTGFVSVNYNGNQQPPSITQIQPVVDNTDPLNVSVGNALLKPAFRNSVWFNLGQWKPITGQGFYIYGNLSFIQHDFSTRDVIDNQGKRSFQTVNVDGNYNARASGNYNMKLKKLGDIGLGIGPELGFNRNMNFVNGAANINNSSNIGGRLNINKEKEKIFDIGVSYSPVYYQSKSSINRSTTRYWYHSIESWGNLTIFKDVKIGNYVSANLRQKTSLFTQNVNTVMWNMDIRKKLFKKKDISAIFSVNDILNKNIGFERNISTNIISENTFNTVKRYWLLTFQWKFSKNSKNSDD